MAGQRTNQSSSRKARRPKFGLSHVGADLAFIAGVFASKAIRGCLAPAMGLAVRTLSILDPHLDPLRKPRITVPELGTARRDRSSEATSGHTVHRDLE